LISAQKAARKAIQELKEAVRRADEANLAWQKGEQEARQLEFLQGKGKGKGVGAAPRAASHAAPGAVPHAAPHGAALGMAAQGNGERGLFRMSLTRDQRSQFMQMVADKLCDLLPTYGGEDVALLVQCIEAFLTEGRPRNEIQSALKDFLKESEVVPFTDWLSNTYQDFAKKSIDAYPQPAAGINAALGSGFKSAGRDNHAANQACMSDKGAAEVERRDGAQRVLAENAQAADARQQVQEKAAMDFIRDMAMKGKGKGKGEAAEAFLAALEKDDQLPAEARRNAAMAFAASMMKVAHTSGA